MKKHLISLIAAAWMAFWLVLALYVGDIVDVWTVLAVGCLAFMADFFFEHGLPDFNRCTPKTQQSSPVRGYTAGSGGGASRSDDGVYSARHEYYEEVSGDKQ